MTAPNIARAASTSSAFAARMALTFCSKASAIASSASFFFSGERQDSSVRAAFARVRRASV